jgi:hypothetical protein
MEKLMKEVEKYSTESTHLDRFVDVLIDKYGYFEKPEDMIDLMFGTKEMDGLAQTGKLDFVVGAIYQLSKKHKLTAAHKERLFPILKQVTSVSKVYDTKHYALRLLAEMYRKKGSKLLKNKVHKFLLSAEGPLNDDNQYIKKLAMTIVVDLGILSIGEFTNGRVVLTETESK